MKKFTVPNNKGYSPVIIIVAVVGALVLLVGGYFLFFNKNGFNPLSFMSKCNASEKICNHFDNINKLREEKKLTALKWGDSATCSRIQNLANDIKELFKDKNDMRYFSYNDLKNLENIVNDSKYRDLVGKMPTDSEDKKKDKRVNFYSYTLDSGSFEESVSEYKTLTPSLHSNFTEAFTNVCIVKSESKIEGKTDFYFWYFYEFKK